MWLFQIIFIYLFSLNIKSLSPIRALHTSCSAFLLLSCIPLYGRTRADLNIHLLWDNMVVSGFFFFFLLILAITNKGATSNHVQVFVMM